ncbi:MAG: M3 family oligoendopeptidase [Anaerolineaceae bacterium]
MKLDKPTRWDVSNIYPSLESPEFQNAFSDMTTLIADVTSFLNNQLVPLSADSSSEILNKKISTYLDKINTTVTLNGKISSYLYSFISTDSYNKLAQKLVSEFEQISIDLQNQNVVFKGWLSQFADRLDAIVEYGGTAGAHKFSLQESIHQSKFLMSHEKEALAAELNLSGASAWEKLHGIVTSQLSVDFELDGKMQKLPAPALINLRGHPVEEVRRRGYEAELKAWKTVEETLAAAMNGIKGTVNTLNKHRNRVDALHSALDAARIDRQALDAMLSAMRDSFPMFREYFKAKASLFGQEKLPWWNLFAPVGKSDTVFTFEEAKKFIFDNFSKFDQGLADFAVYAFDHYWIDAEQRDGKMGGAFCMDIPGTGESRIMCNFDGSMDQVSTIAHELGHGFHNDCEYKANRTQLQKDTPMTLAETASIMCETIVSNAALKLAANPEEELAILDGMLVGDSQVIVDIYSRFLFEKEVFERREKSVVSADELNEIMLSAQKATYGDGLDENYLQKYMWTWKPHYYSQELSFYNFPYAFGLLFATGLYAIYQERGSAFVPEYKDLLSCTGMDQAVDLAKRFDIDIQQKSFWEGSLKIVAQRVERYKALVANIKK